MSRARTAAPPATSSSSSPSTPSPLYERRDADLVLDVPITYPEAVLGATVEIPTPEGPVNLKVPAGTESGKLLRVKGRGAPKLKGGGKGDLLARVKVTVPQKLTKAEKEALEGYDKVLRERPRDRAFRLMSDRPRYMISVAAELAGMHPQTLRAYEAKGLVTPARTPGGTRLYSEHDVERLRLIQQLTTKLGLNLAGVEHVLRLEDELRRLRARMEQLEAALRTEIHETHRQYRREVVLYRPQPPATPTLNAVPRRRTMDFNKLTIKSGEAVAGAQELARRAGNPELTRDHLTVALLEQELPRTLLQRAGADPSSILRRGRGAPAGAAGRLAARTPQPQAGGAFRKALDDAFDEARKLDDEFVSVEHLVLALELVPREALLGALKEVRGGQRVTTQDPEGTYEALSKYGRDLTAAAEAGKLDPVIGRDEEIRRTIQVLSRRTKNNPVLIGEPGVGKTAIAEGPRPAHRRRRRAGGAEGQARLGARRRRADRRREVPRRVRGAAEGRARRDHRRRGRDRPLHRRAAHDRRRRCRRGRRVGGQPAQADAGARRASGRRRDDPRRVPQAHREGRGARAALPAGARRRAVRRRHDRDPARASRSATRRTTASASATRR